MKLKAFLYIAICTFFLASCGSNKNVVKSSPKRVVLEEQKEVNPELPQFRANTKTCKNK